MNDEKNLEQYLCHRISQQRELHKVSGGKAEQMVPSVVSGNMEEEFRGAILCQEKAILSVFKCRKNASSVLRNTSCI
jgi:hypothetical protein